MFIVMKLLRTLFCIGFFLLSLISEGQNAINRQALVLQHNVINTKADPLSSLTVGNGHFAYTVDITGVQSFPEAYAAGIPLGTQSTWGWHSFIDTAGYRYEETLKPYRLNGRDITYAVQW